MKHGFYKETIMEWIYLLSFIVVLGLLLSGIGLVTSKPKDNNNHIYYYAGKPEHPYKNFR